MLYVYFGVTFGAGFNQDSGFHTKNVLGEIKNWKLLLNVPNITNMSNALIVKYAF